jgi:hypothetical protein
MDLKTQLKELIRQTIKSAYIQEYQEKATDTDALGLILSAYFEYDGLAILKTAYSALEDANFHAENIEIKKLIDKLEKENV